MSDWSSDALSSTACNNEYVDPVHGFVMCDRPSGHEGPHLHTLDEPSPADEASIADET